MKILSGIFMLLMITTQCFAQKLGQNLIDSLVKELPKQTNDSLKIRMLKRISDEYFFIDPDRAMQYSRTGLRYAEKAKWNRAIGNFYMSIARAFSDKGNYDSSMAYNNRALTIYKKANDKFNIATTLNNMGAAEQNFNSDYPKATKYYLEALKISETFNDKLLSSVCYDNLSHIFFYQGNYKKALDYAFKSLKLREEIIKEDPSASPREVGNALANIGAIYTEIKEETKARSFYQRAVPMLEKSGNLEGLAKSYSSLAILAGTDDALKLAYGKKAEKLWNEVNPMHLDAANNLATLGVAYFDLAKKDSSKNSGTTKNDLLNRARSYLEKAIRISDQKGEIGSRAYFLANLSELQALTGDYRSAYINFRTFQSVQDSLYSQESKNEIAELEGKREIELRDKQIEINKLELEGQKKLRLGLIIGLGLLTVIGALLYWQNQTKKRTNTTLLHLNSELDEANKIKARFFAILSHDLRSPVANLINFLHLQKEEPDLLTPELAEMHQKRITESAEDLLENMESMLLWSKGQMQHFKPQVKSIPVEDLFNYIRKFFAGTGNVSFHFNNPDNLTVVTDEDYLKTIMQNLTSNAIKALRKTPDASIKWEAKQENGQIILAILDNGPGATEQQLHALYSEEEVSGGKTGLGFYLIRDLAKAISCKISVKTNVSTGMEFQLTLKTV